MAPKIMYRISKVMNKPCMVEARILINGNSQARKATNAVNKNPMGMASRAGIRNPTSITATTKMGKSARNDNRDKDIMFG
jgi:hypothetical protein